jgi:hypothetical protein
MVFLQLQLVCVGKGGNAANQQGYNSLFHSGALDLGIWAKAFAKSD